MTGGQAGCRSDLAGQPGLGRWAQGTLFGLFLIGFWLVVIYVRQIPAADRFAAARAEFDLWVVLLGAVGGYTVAASAAFVTWLVGLARLVDRLEPSTVASWVLGVLVVAGTVLASLFLVAARGEESIDKDLATQLRPITLFAGLCTAPGLMAFLAVRSVARDDGNWLESAECRVRLILRLQHELRRLLTTLGAFLTIVVIATGMRRRALLVVDPALSIPVEGVLLYGLVFAAELGFFHQAANSAVDARGRRLLDEFAAIPDPTRADVADQLGRRNSLAPLLTTGGSWGAFQSSVVIAAPLVSALIGAAITG
jgi:hypothetical protein